MQNMSPATFDRARGFRLISRMSKKEKGTAKWKTKSAPATHCQPPRERGRYQLISSGRLAIQISMNSKKVKYAQMTRKVNRRLPRSLSVSGETMSASGG